MSGNNIVLQARQRKASRRTTVQRYWSLLFLVVLIAFCSIFGKGFLSFDSLQNILLSSCTIMILGIGQTFVMISGGMDMSVAFTSGLATVVAAQLMKGMGSTTGVDPALIVACGFLAGISVCVIPGLANGLLVSRLKVSPFIATLGMYGIARGVGLLISNGYPIGKQPELLGKIGNGYLLYYYKGHGFSFFKMFEGIEHSELRSVVTILPYPVIVLVICLLVLHFVLSRTRFGLHTYAIGGSEEAAIRAGVNVAREITKIYILSAVMAGVAGMVYTMRYTSGNANAGEPKLLDSIAAVVIGGVSLSGGSGTIIPGTLIGALIIAVLQTGLVSMGISPYYQFLAVGLVIVLAVVVDQALPRIYGRS